MNHPFPETPATLLATLERGDAAALRHQAAWETFFHLYHAPLRCAVAIAYRRCGWHHVSDADISAAVMDVVLSFLNARTEHDPAQGRFRHYLRQLALWRVQDRIKAHARRAEEPLPADFAEAFYEAEPSAALCEREEETFRKALLASLLEDVRRRVSPETYAIFEQTKCLGVPPEEVATRFGVSRNVVDNAAWRVMKQLRQLAAQPEYQREYHS